MLYRYLLMIHVVGIISWMAGLLYLFRLFIYHAEEPEGVVKARFVIMEERLYRIITVPAMVVSIVVGLYLLYLSPTLMRERWLHVKLFCVFGLVVLTRQARKMRMKLQSGELRLSSKTLRIINEIPTLLMIVIVWMVIVRPFV